MAERKGLSAISSPRRLKPEQLRVRCDPASFGFKSTGELEDCPINIIGQDRAQEALRVGLALRSDGFNIFVTGHVGSGRSTVVRRTLKALEPGKEAHHDLVYVHNFTDPDLPRCLVFPAKRGRAFHDAMVELIDALQRDLPQLYDSDAYRKQRSLMIEAASNEQKSRLKEFETLVQEQGFALVQVQMGPLTRPNLVPVVAGNPVEIEKLEELVEQGQFRREDLDELQRRLVDLRSQMESLGKVFRQLDREVRHKVAELDRKLAEPLVQESISDVQDGFEADGLEDYLVEVAEDVLDNLDSFREANETQVVVEGTQVKQTEIRLDVTRFDVNVIVDNSNTRGRPVIWETAPSYRNLFGTIEKVRTSSGEWETDHTRIKAGSLLRASGGILVLDAMDVLVEPGVWAALKRTLRNRTVEIRFYDPVHLFSAISLKPAPVPVDVKVVMIGTPQIYRLLFALDEDFKKIFKVKADFATHTPRSDEELKNYACFVHKKVNDDRLAHFKADAVSAVVEHGIRLAGHQDKLTTRFNEIADVIREAGYWAAQDKAKLVDVKHVDRALRQRVQRVNLIEERLREQIAEGTVLLDLEGAKVGQVNALVVLDQGDHVFGQPSRITATTAMGRVGIVDLDREAELSGSLHTKGVLILTGFLRSRFAQDKPLTLSATLCFEQNYGGVDGDSASSAELYALLSSLSEVPLRQGIAVTGSVNQRGEIQPIGGVNEKIEGLFDLCRLTGLTGEQGVMIPARNLPHMSLRKDVIAEVKKKRFHIWAVSTIEEGLEVLTGRPAGERQKDGRYTAGSVFRLADDKLRHLAESVVAFGPADAQ